MTFNINDLKKIIACDTRAQVDFALEVVTSLRDQKQAANSALLENISRQDLKDQEVEDLFHTVVHQNTIALAQFDLLIDELNLNKEKIASFGK